MTWNPFTAPLDAQRQALEQLGDAAEATAIAPDRMATIADVDVGQTPSEVVYRENKLELHHYRPESIGAETTEEVPILVVYALINRPYILDLQPDRSVVRRLLEAGFEVYLIDWGEPSTLDADLSLSDYVGRYIDNCVDVVRDRADVDAINLLGYCMGGTMSATYAALEPEKVNTLGLMAAGLCFAGDGGVLELWGGEEYFDPEEIADTYGIVPAEFFDVGFALMDPIANGLGKYVRLYENVEDEEFVENFARMERWIDEGIDMAGAVYAEFLRDIYQENALYENDLYIDGEHVDLGELTMPVLQIVGHYDHLVPPEASTPFNDVIPSDDVETMDFSTGHIGLSVSSSSHEELWPDVAAWYAERSPAPDVDEGAPDRRTGDVARAEGRESPSPDEKPAVGEEETAAAAEATDGPDDALADAGGVELIEGIGPTYAGRLSEAGVEDVAALAAADASRLADEIDVPQTRVQSWIDEAADRSA